MDSLNPGTPRASKNKWLIGLGIGCGTVVLIIMILLIGGFFFVKNLTKGFNESAGIENSLIEKYGKIEDYCPAPEGVIGQDRLEIFLAVRESFAHFRRKLESTFEELAKFKPGNTMESKSSGNGLSAIRLSFGMVPQISACFKARNQALLDHGMGIGEYLFIYITAYNSWLKKPPDDEPGIEFTRGGGVNTGWKREDVIDMQKFDGLSRIHRTLLPVLRNQLAQLTGQPKTLLTWREALQAEIKAMEADNHRLPWQDGLPEVIEKSLAPFREKLEASYSKMTNVLEIAFQQR